MTNFDDDLEIERNKTVARWFAIIILSVVLFVQRSAYGAEAESALRVFIGSAVVVNLMHSLYLFRTTTCPPFYKYLSVGLDLVILTATIRYTGFNRSPFFFAYFLLLVSNGIRYGLLMSLFIAAAVNLLYVAVLALGPQLEPTVVGGEGLKIIAFWGVAIYGGVVAARMRRQAFEIAAYEQTIGELREQLESARKGQTSNGG